MIEIIVAKINPIIACKIVWKLCLSNKEKSLKKI